VNSGSGELETLASLWTGFPLLYTAESPLRQNRSHRRLGTVPSRGQIAAAWSWCPARAAGKLAGMGHLKTHLVCCESGRNDEVALRRKAVAVA
jgi:hypothetical protein